MVPLPRLLIPLHHYQVPNSRYFKAGSPTRNWIMNPKLNRAALPPQNPCRRGSTNNTNNYSITTTPISSLALLNNNLITPNRSRSLDGLLDSSEPKLLAANNNNNNAEVAEKLLLLNPSDLSNDKKISNNLSTKINDNNNPTDDDHDDDDNSVNKYTNNNFKKIINKAHSAEDILENGDEIDQQSQNSDSIKRKKSFMDRCVNKVRSLIRK